jgi:hypothetical protein
MGKLNGGMTKQKVLLKKYKKSKFLQPNKGASE